jgi:hypothetical protein
MSLQVLNSDVLFHISTFLSLKELANYLVLSRNFSKLFDDKPENYKKRKQEYEKKLAVYELTKREIESVRFDDNDVLLEYLDCIYFERNFLSKQSLFICTFSANTSPTCVCIPQFGKLPLHAIGACNSDPKEKLYKIFFLFMKLSKLKNFDCCSTSLSQTYNTLGKNFLQQNKGKVLTFLNGETCVVDEENLKW